MRNFDNTFLNIAHRGASGHAPENTLAAFRKAIELGADGIECDVQLTKDGFPIILHDYTLERTSNSAGFALDRRLDEIKRVDAGAWYSSEFRGEAIPTLQELFEFAGKKLLLNIELKKSPNPENLVEKTNLLIRTFKRVQQCLITSFDNRTVELVNTLMPDCCTGLLVDKLSPDMWEGKWDFIVVQYELVNAALIRQAKEHHKKIIAWTVNDDKDMEKLLDLGIGRIITNYPGRYKALLREKKLDS